MNSYPFLFSICTLVTDWDEYAVMRVSFERNGFDTDSCEYLVADNSKGNKYDAYQAFNSFLHNSKGRYAIVCHQDVELMEDGIEKLRSLISELDEKHPNWAVAGNAGGLHIKKLKVRITEKKDKVVNLGPFPAQVYSLDENFIVLKKSTNLGLSHRLQGFHLYATDLCLQADSLGYTCHVIDFHLHHKSSGTVNDSFYEQKNALINNYAAAWRPRYIQTTCTRFFISGSRFWSKLFNLKFPMFLAKEYYKRLK